MQEKKTQRPIHMKRLNTAICVISLTFFLVSDTGVVIAQERNEQYQLIFSDEFNQKNGSQPNPQYWSHSPRGYSIWNRWIGRSKKIVYIHNGKLICRAIRNTENPADTAMMITGAVETINKFAFQYGKIEVRAKTKSHTGNFPAIWLMPQPPANTHPIGGEIDIFETFGDKKKAHQTIHTNWTYNLKHTNPSNTFNTDINVERWHVYGIEWTESSIRFTIDGKLTGFYLKSTDQEALDNKQWPFDHPFYIILNQSVWENSPWGGAPDPKFVYETQFDWVRVYQRAKLRQ